jgi:hypothetical protein
MRRFSLQGIRNRAPRPASAFDADPLRRRDAIELLDAFHTIEDPDLRRRLTELARGLAAGAKPK